MLFRTRRIRQPTLWRMPTSSNRAGAAESIEFHLRRELGTTSRSSPRAASKYLPAIAAAPHDDVDTHGF